MELTRQKPNPSPQNRLSRLRETKTAPSVGAVSPHRCWHQGQWRPGQTTGVDGGRHAHWDLPEAPPSPWVPECWSRRDTSATQWHLPRPRPQQTAADQRACVRAGAPCSECALRGAAWRAPLALFVLLPSGARPTRPTLGEAALVPACALHAAESPVRGAACADPGTAIGPQMPAWHRWSELGGTRGRLLHPCLEQPETRILPCPRTDTGLSGLHSGVTLG